MAEIKNIFKAVALLVVFSVILKVIGFFMRIILSRELGAEALGAYQVALSFYGVLCTIVASGIPVTISHYSARATVKKDFKGESSAVSASLILGLITSAIIIVAVFLFAPVITAYTNSTSTKILLYLLPAVFFTGVYGSFRGALWGRKRHLDNCLSEVGEQVFRLILFLILLSTARNPTTAAFRAAICVSLSCFVSMALSIYFYFRHNGKLFHPKMEMRSVLKTSFTITSVRVISSLAQPIIAILLPMRLVEFGFSSEQALGLFGIALGMTMPLLSLPGTVISSYATALIPELSSSLEEKNMKEFNNQTRTAICFSLFVCFCFVPIYLGLGEQIGILLFNNASSGYLLTKTCWIIVPIGICGITHSILNTLGLETRGFLHQIAGFVVLLASVWFLPKYIGITALGYGMGGCMSVTTILNCLLIYKKTNISGLILKPLGMMIVFCIPSSLICSSLFGIFKYIFSPFITVCLSAGLGLISFVLLCLIFNVVNISSVFIKVKDIRFQKLKKRSGKSLT